MKFNQFEKVYESISQDALQGILQKTFSSTLVAQVVNIFSSYPQSKLTQFILGRLELPEKYPTQKFETRKVGTLEACQLDPVVYDLLLKVKENGVGPGEVLISLVAGKWEGGTQAGYDVFIPEVGKVEIKYLEHFEHSSNVPLGSSHEKNIEHSEFYEIIQNIGNIVRQTPEVLKNVLKGEELDYFIRNTLDQITNPQKNLSSNSIRLIAKLLRNCETYKVQTFSSKGITFKKLTQSMEKSVLDAVGNVEYIMFIGDRVKADPTNPYNNIVYKGQYYLMPKQDIKYYMVYRMFNHERIKMAPFMTEKEFLENTIKGNE